MQLGSEAQIPDGLLAANALLGENSHQGVPTSTHALHQGFGFVISNTALGLKGSLYDEGVWSRYTGKERDTESGLDYFGARYYGSNMGRFMSPDPINLTDERLMNPSNTLNKYAYGANNPLKYVDHDGKDITLFYDPSGVTHLALAAYNPQAGTGIFESFAPSSHTLGDQASELLGNDASGSVSDYKVSQFGNADFLRSNYASLTIQTSPEVTQEVVTYINSHPDGNWNLYSNNCSDACTRALHAIQIAIKGGTPTSAFTNLLASHGSKAGQQLFTMDRFNVRKGIEYGKPGPGIDPFRFLQLLAQHCETVTSTIKDSNGNTISSSSHQNCHF